MFMLHSLKPVILPYICINLPSRHCLWNKLYSCKRILFSLHLHLSPRSVAHTYQVPSYCQMWPFQTKKSGHCISDVATV